MALKEVELRPGWFVYRCEFCGFQEPQMGVKKHLLKAPPAHSCPESRQLSFGEILKKR